MNPIHLIEPWVAVDCESTGLDSRARLIELAAIAGPILLAPLLTFESFVNPCQRIPSEISKLTGISTLMVESAPQCDVVLTKFLEWLQGRLLVIHNACFDLQLMAQEARRTGLDLPVLRYIDTIPLARFLGETPNVRLSTIAEHHQWDEHGCHRALADATITAKFFNYALSHPRRDEYSHLLQPQQFYTRGR